MLECELERHRKLIETMTCRHKDKYNNPDCSSYDPRYRMAELRDQLKRELTPEIEAEVIKRRLVEKASDSPDPSDFDILEIVEVGPHLAARVQYPNCAKCAFEGIKVMVFLNVRLKDAVRWKVLDPHFRGEASTPRQAPSPAARFPASDEGWQDALNYAQTKQKGSSS